MNRVLVGRYELVEKIGEGGMAVVYKAKDRLLNRYVAVKILRPEFTKDVQFVESFRKESQAAAGLQHPNIISVFDVGREGDIHFIVMEMVEGIPLSDYIKNNAPLPYKEVVNISKQVAQALSIAHKNNIIHRDIKPHNIMLTNDGTAKLGDFGIAKAISDATLTETSTIIGSVHYFSPEQARGSYVDERSDIYSLGIIMYEMLTGQVPFDGDNPVQVALMHINNDMTPPSQLVNGIPPALEKVVMTATNKFQSNRYKSVDLMIEDLDNIEFVTRMMGTETEKSQRIQKTDTTTIYVPADDDSGEDEEKSTKKSTNKKKTRGRIAIFAIIVILLLAGGVFALTRIGIIGGVVVPDVVGMTEEEATTALEKEGFEVVVGDSITSDQVEKGEVAMTNPKADTKAKKGSTITIYVSSGLGNGTVPVLVGKYYDEDSIKSLLSASGYELGEISQEESENYEKNQIISQSPQGGTSAEKGSKIDIVICSKKIVKNKVPSVTGTPVEDAIKSIQAAGLDVGTITYEESSVYAAGGYVIHQSISAGTEIEEGTAIDLVVSKEKASDNGDDNSDSNTDNGNTEPDANTGEETEG